MEKNDGAAGAPAFAVVWPLHGSVHLLLSAGVPTACPRPLLWLHLFLNEAWPLHQQERTWQTRGNEAQTERSKRAKREIRAETHKRRPSMCLLSQAADALFNSFPSRWRLYTSFSLDFLVACQPATRLGVFVFLPLLFNPTIFPSRDQHKRRLMKKHKSPSQNES